MRLENTLLTTATSTAALIASQSEAKWHKEREGKQR